MHLRHLAAWLAAAALLAGCGTSVPTIRLEAEPSPTGAASPPAVSPSPTPSETTDAGTETPSPTETGPREATDTDRARFVADHQPEGASNLQHVATDLDGDGTAELLFAYVRGGQFAHVDVAWWTGTTYELTFADDGGNATRIDGLRADDVNADGLTEIVTSQSGPDEQASLSIWQVAGPRQVARLAAGGGCHDRSHTYGVTGAVLEDRDADGAAEVYATCPDGSTDRYRWESGVYRHAPQLVR